MLDDTTTIAELKQTFEKFMSDRGWNNLGSAKDLSMDIVSEAVELMDLCIFIAEDKLNEKLEKHRQEVENELADIAFALFNFCLRYNVDLTQAVKYKMILNEQKYPINLV
jgi:dCTP diphosphatase